jgi:hypothetical protein
MMAAQQPVHNCQGRCRLHLRKDLLVLLVGQPGSTYNNYCHTLGVPPLPSLVAQVLLVITSGSSCLQCTAVHAPLAGSLYPYNGICTPYGEE